MIYEMRATHSGSLIIIAFAGTILWGQSIPDSPQPPGLKDRDLIVRPNETSPPPGPSIPKGYALVIGVGRYQNLPEGSNLRYSESDAEAMYRVLISAEFGDFSPENVHKLIGPEATLANIRKELEVWLPSVAKADDRVVVYFAGHGLVADGRGFIAPWDVRTDDLANTAYPMAQLAKVLSRDIKSTHKVLFTDACHSGKITPESSDENIAAQWKLQESPYFLTLTATSEREQSFEDPKLSTGFGIFTYFLVQALQGQADTQPCDGLVTADELVSYVTRQVHEYTRARNVYQTPVALGDYDPALVMAVSRGCPQTGGPSAPDVGTMTVESNMDGVDLYMDDKLVGTVSKSAPLTLPGLAAGVHTFKGVRKGYQPDTKQQMVIPGQAGSVQIRIQYPVENKRSAVDAVEQGEKALFSHRSAVDPLYFARQGQSADSLKGAADLFRKALKEDASYARAAYDLGLTAQLLSDERTMLSSFRQAIQIDPSYIDARLQYASVLIESGDTDEAIRQATEAIRLEPKSDQAYSYLSRAYLDKDVYDRAIQAASQAIGLRADNEQAYLWRAEALRRQASARGTKDPQSKQLARQEYEQARDDFRHFVNKTNFQNPAYEQIAFYFIGFGIGARSHADRQQSYAYQRTVAFQGLCSCEKSLGNPMKATAYCQQAIHYDSKDPVTYFLLGNAYRDLYNSYTRLDDLLSARKSYAQSLSLNPDLEFSVTARGYLESIDTLLASARLKKMMN
jgi:tetratricopeptide (TPR) repeat protein